MDATWHHQIPTLDWHIPFRAAGSVGCHRCVLPGELPLDEGSCLTQGYAPLSQSSWYPVTDGCKVTRPSSPLPQTGQLWGALPSGTLCGIGWSFWYSYITVQPHSINTTSFAPLPVLILGALTNTSLPINLHLRAVSRGPNPKQLVAERVLASWL